MAAWQRWNIWLALMLRDISTRGGESRLRYLIVLLEPFGQFVMMYGVFIFINRRPDFGRSLFVFLASGLIPYFLFTHVASRVGGAVRSGARRPEAGPVALPDRAIARFVVESLTVVIMATTTLGLATIFGTAEASPAHVLTLVSGFVLTALLAFGVGLANGILSVMFGAYAMIWSIVARSLIFFSGVFYTVDFLPKAWRAVVSINPVLHASIMFRQGLYRAYPAATLDLPYLWSWILGSTLLGLLLINRRVIAR